MSLIRAGPIPLLMKMMVTRMIRLLLVDSFFPRVIKIWCYLLSPSIYEIKHRRGVEASR